MQRVLRWDVPVDDAWHKIGAGDVVHVATCAHRERPGDLVEVWTLEETARDGIQFDELRKRAVIAVGTGHPVPDNTRHIGSAVVPTFSLVPSMLRGGKDSIESRIGLVWHVFERYDPEAERQALAEEGRRLASAREDLIAQGHDPSELPVPLHPDPLPTPTTNGELVSRLRDVAGDEATSLAYWLANELGEHVDDQDGETLTQTVQRLIAARLAPDDAPAVPITDWTDFHVGDVVVQTPDLSAPGSPEFAADLLVRRPGGVS